MELIKTLKTYRLHNREHLHYMTVVKNLIESASSEYLDVEVSFSAFLKLYEQEKLQFQKSSENFLMGKLEESDTKRDDYHRGITLVIKGYLRYPHKELRDAAKELQKILNKYRDLRPLPYDEESVALNHFCDDMFKNKPLLQKLHLLEWVELLKEENITFENYMFQRKQQFVAEQVNLKTVRHLLDQCYKALVLRIEAFALIEKTGHKYNDFVSLLNKEVDHFNSIYLLQKSDEAQAAVFEHYHPESFY